MKNYFISGLLLIGVFHSCNNNDNLEAIDNQEEISDIKIEDNLLIQKIRNTNPSSVNNNLTIDELADSFKQAKDKEKILDELQDKVESPINRELIRQMLMSSSPNEFIYNNAEKLVQKNAADFKEIFDTKKDLKEMATNNRGSNNKNTYPDFESTDFEIVDRDNIVFLDEISGVDYAKKSVLNRRVADDLKRARKWSNDPGKPNGVFVGKYVSKIGKTTNPYNKFGWKKAEIRMRVIPPSQKNYNTLVKDTRIGYWKLVKKTSAFTRTLDEDRPEGDDVDSGELELSSGKEVSFSNEFSIGTSAKVGFDAGVIFAQGKTEFSIDLAYSRSWGEADISSTTQTFSESAYLEPGESVTFFPCERRKRIKYEIKTPVEMKNMVAVDFGKKVEGHYFYAIDANTVFRDALNENLKITINEDVYNEIKIIKVRYNKKGKYKSSTDMLNHLAVAGGSY